MSANSVRSGPRWRRNIAIAGTLGLALAAPGQNVPTITTVAGGGPIDGLPATASVVAFPFGVASDGSGNLFISDVNHSRIRKVDSNGIITTVAGTGIPGFSGDGGPATSASLWIPGGLALDTHGNLFFSDIGNNRVRKVDASGVITTVAGNGTPAFSGDGVPAISASVALSFPNNGIQPSGVAVDSAGNLFIADSFNERVRKVDTQGVITTVAGNGIAQFSGDNGPATKASLCGPAGLAFDGLGNLFIGDLCNSRIRKVDTKGIITTVAGDGFAGFSGDGGPATQAGMTPVAATPDRAGNLFIVDSTNSRIRKVDTNGIINTVAGNGVPSFAGDNGPATAAEVQFPEGVAVDGSGNLLIADTSNDRIRKVDSQGIITTSAGNGTENFLGDGGPATKALLKLPSGIVADGLGNLFIADSQNSRIRKVDSNGTITTVAGNGQLSGACSVGPATSVAVDPGALIVDPAGNLLMAQGTTVCKMDSHGNITMVAGSGGDHFSGDGGPATGAGLGYASDLALDGPGNLFIATEEFAYRVRKVDTSGIIATVAGNGNPAFTGDNGPATSASLNFPGGVAIDSQGRLFIGDTDNNRIRMVDSNGIITTIAGNGIAGFSGDGGPATGASLNAPMGVRLSAGNLFFADSGNHRIRTVNPAGIIATLAGNGTPGFFGDGGPATSASLNTPVAVVLDGAGHLFIADHRNDRIRKVTLPGFTITASPPGATIRAGQSANFTLTVAPQNGFAGSISFACSGLPSFSSCTFNPTSVTASGSPVNVALTVHTSGPNAALRAPAFPLGGQQAPRPALALWTLGGPMGMLALVLAGKVTDQCGRRQMFVVLGAMLLLAITGCGGGSASSPPPPTQLTPAGVSMVTVTATAADSSVVNVAAISVTVTQ